uniref:NADH-ubiquinone oxidoreductase chain 2 n=1 Tax=Termitogeton planus TaxID=127398 RepID=A0A0A7EAQ8_9NEOP|nr:NADH dehydrogenase subunit 2 [Termitogeton planus]URH16606.1 NADH dehydrogenase subunit 2 [Termitogeton planus]
MPNNSTKILLLSTLVMGMLVSVSANSWLSAWMGLEINLMSFIPLMSNPKNMYNTEASLKYFITQVLASATLLFTITMSAMAEDLFTLHGSNPTTSSIICMPLLLKTGTAPLHWWFPGVMEGLSWGNCVLLMTIQSAAPMMLMSYLISTSTFTSSIILTSVIMGAIGGLNQTSTRKIMTYSSINHTGWMVMTLTMGETMWTMYFSIYSILVIAVVSTISLSETSFINQIPMASKENTLTKIMMLTSLLSLSGMPPFLGFMPKWIVAQEMIMNNAIPLATVMVTMSLVTLYYYLKISYSSFTILSTEQKWNQQPQKNEPSKTAKAMIMTSISLTGMIVYATINNIQ